MSSSSLIPSLASPLCSFLYQIQAEQPSTPRAGRPPLSTTTKETIKSSLSMNNSNSMMYPTELEVEVSAPPPPPWQQWQQKSSGDLMDDFVSSKEEQHMTLPNPRREDENEAKYRFLPVPAFRRSSSISSQYSVRS
jgi:hypothetical protein